MKFGFCFKKGISFYELIIVLSIIGLIAALTIPAIRNYLPFWQLSGNSRLLLNKLRQAQEEAVSVQKQHAIRFTSTIPPVTYQLIKIDAGETVLDTVIMPENLTISLDPAFTDNQVIFSSDGGPNCNGNITVTLNTSSKIIIITPAGVIKLQ